MEYKPYTIITFLKKKRDCGQIVITFPKTKKKLEQGLGISLDQLQEHNAQYWFDQLFPGYKQLIGSDHRTERHAHDLLRFCKLFPKARIKVTEVK